MKLIYYSEGYKYQLCEDYEYQLGPEWPDVPHDWDTEYFYLDHRKLLVVKDKYAWDGPSGPTIDTKNFMRGSLVHDCLYQMIREGYLDKDQCRILADKELYKIVRDDGMNWFRANLVYYSVRIFGNRFAWRGSITIEHAP